MPKLRYATILLIAVLSALSLSAQAAITVTDDLGKTVTLARPAQRVISLSPHVTELIFAAGGGDKIIGTVKYSDFPAAAKAIPRIGDNRQIDLERVIAMKPDLLVVWMHGAFERQLETLQRSGIPYFFSEPHRLSQIPETLLKLGSLLGTEQQAQRAANDFRQQTQALMAQYQHKRPVRTFYQVWGKPLYTLNDTHIVSDAIRLCGGVNIFGKLPVVAPTLSIEAVLQENPEVILSGDSDNQAVSGVQQWQQFASLQATRDHHLYSVPADLLNRSGPRIIQGAKAICEALEKARQDASSSQSAGGNAARDTAK